MITTAISSFVATFGFGILFNIRGRKLFIAGIAGALGAVVYTYGLNNSMDEVSAMLCASIIFSLFSEVCARIYHTPVTTFVICALIPLVPGNGMYNAMVQAVSGDMSRSLQVVLDTLSKAGALALGIILVSTITRLYFRWHNIIHQRKAS